MCVCVYMKTRHENPAVTYRAAQIPVLQEAHTKLVQAKVKIKCVIQTEDS